jgi:hypothetical protein
VLDNSVKQEIHFSLQWLHQSAPAMPVATVKPRLIYEVHTCLILETSPYTFIVELNLTNFRAFTFIKFNKWQKWQSYKLRFR